MKIAIINSNYISISQNTKKGTEIFDYIFTGKLAERENIDIVSFASGDSELPTRVESVNYLSSMEDSLIGRSHHAIFELALISKAFSMQEQFDLFHININNGEVVLPFAPFVKKPIVVTMHGTLFDLGVQKYFHSFQHLKHVHFVSISNSQRIPCPGLNYIRTIYHGVDLENRFKFDEAGGEEIIWTGRAMPDKGLDTVLIVAEQTKKKAKIFPIVKEEYLQWLHQEILKKRSLMSELLRVFIDFDVPRYELIKHYQKSKVFLFPLRWEEPFGLTLIESLACGTPVIAFARGSMPEIIEDGVTGFIVNASDTDKRGDWIVKKTGVEGLCEAVERVYQLNHTDYRNMRKNCRKLVEQKFSLQKVVDQYLEVYQQLI